MEYNNYTVDTDKSEEGVWMEHDGAKFKIARFGNPKFTSYMETLFKPYKRQGASQAKTIELGAKALAKYILLDWDGLKVNGVVVEYSYDKALELLSNPGADEFRDLISNLSQDEEQFREEQVTKTEKKSATT